MPFVIAEPCVGVKDKSCVAVCPVDAIHGDDTDSQLFIDPEECICCSLCEPECPVDAIFMDDELPQKWSRFVQLNADYYRSRG